MRKIDESITQKEVTEVIAGEVGIVREFTNKIKEMDQA